MVAGLFTTSLLSLFLPIIALAGPHGSSSHFHRHHDLARRAQGSMELYHRESNVEFTFYDTDTGSA